MRNKLNYILQKLLGIVLNSPIIPEGKTTGYSLVKSQKAKFIASDNVRFVPPYYFTDVSIGDYTYIGANTQISNAEIGKFCSIGPNFCCGLGIHPTNGISTSPMFYSTARQNGESLASINKIAESKRTFIGNDVFIGANVTLLDGVCIGDGTVIGAGAVVTKDIPPYAIAVGVPAKVVKYRFTENQIEELLKIKWWNFEDEKLQDIEKYFFEIDAFINKYKK
jgi:acetyltransferase-like isoleucine patch superfamily enzyme